MNRPNRPKIFSIIYHLLEVSMFYQRIELLSKFATRSQVWYNNFKICILALLLQSFNYNSKNPSNVLDKLVFRVAHSITMFGFKAYENFNNLDSISYLEKLEISSTFFSFRMTTVSSVLFMICWLLSGTRKHSSLLPLSLIPNPYTKIISLFRFPFINLLS